MFLAKVLFVLFANAAHPQFQLPETRRFAITLSKAAFMLGLPFGQNQNKQKT